MANQVSQEERDRVVIELREKARRDHRWRMETARREGREEGFKEGFVESFIRGFQETYQEFHGQISNRGATCAVLLIAQIRKLQGTLGETVTDIDELEMCDEAELKRLSADLLECLANQSYQAHIA